MKELIIDPYTNKPFKSLKEFELYRDLEYFIQTGKHRRPELIRWKTRKLQVA